MKHSTTKIYNRLLQIFHGRGERLCAVGLRIATDLDHLCVEFRRGQQHHQPPHPPAVDLFGCLLFMQIDVG